MILEEHNKVKKIFNSALQKEPAERRKFLDEMCDGDEELRSEVESLLSSYGSAESFMETPAVGKVTEKHQLTNGQEFVHYEVIFPIGSGGMGEIYLAHDLNLNANPWLNFLHRASACSIVGTLPH